MSIFDIRKSVAQEMQRSIDAFKNDLSKIHPGRAHTSLLDHVQVDYYGSMIPIDQVANLTLLDARTIIVQPWEKAMVAKVEKAICEADLGLNPTMQGGLIRVPMPALTEQRRRELTKFVMSEGEMAKSVVRNLRRDANEQLNELLKDKEISEVDERRASEDVQSLTVRYVAEIDGLAQMKVAEIMKV